VLESPRIRRSFIAWKEVPDKCLVNKGKRLTFSLQTGQWHEFPLLDEEVAAFLAGRAYFLELFFHEFSFNVGYALGECAFNVNGKSVGALDSCFHGCGGGGVESE